jgi:hypothetical protein
MPKKVTFADLLKIENGNIAVAQENLPYIEKLMRAAGADYSEQLHLLVGQGIREPIRQLAAYKSWTDMFFMLWPIGPKEDNKIPVDRPIAAAWITHGEGEALFVRPHTEWARPDWVMIDAAVEIPWDVMEAAGWPILNRKLTEAAEEMARQKDTQAQTILNAAVTGVAGHVFTVAGAITKVSIDAVFAAAAAIGFPIKQVAIGGGTVLAMRGWTGSTFGLEALPEAEVRDLLYRGYLGEYGGAAWYAHHSVPTNYVYFSGPPDEVGYHQIKGGTRVASDVDITQRIDLHTMDEKHAWYVGNAYSLWRLQIT